MDALLDKRLKVIRDNIRSERLLKSYSQEYMGYRLAISQNAYSKIELGFTVITLKRLFQIAAILDIDANIILELVHI